MADAMGVMLTQPKAEYLLSFRRGLPYPDAMDFMFGLS